MTPFNLKPAAEAIGISLAVHALVAFGIFAMFVVAWGPILARLM